VQRAQAFGYLLVKRFCDVNELTSMKKLKK